MISLINWVDNISRYSLFSERIEEYSGLCVIIYVGKYLGSLESFKTLEPKFIFNIGSLVPHGMNIDAGKQFI